MALNTSSKSSWHLKNELPRDVTQVMAHEVLGTVSGGRHTEQERGHEREHLTVISGMDYLSGHEAWGQCQFSPSFLS